MAIQSHYDVIIVGSGHAGAYMAYHIGMKFMNTSKRVLIIEAGAAAKRNREDYMETFFLSTFKSPESPYPPNAAISDPAHTNAPRPTVNALVEAWDKPEHSYLTYPSAYYSDGKLADDEKPVPFASTYERVAGGTGLHWMGTSLRMAPSDFKLHKNYGHGKDWPLDYADLEKHYAKVEYFIGVAADASEQRNAGLLTTSGYEYPMPALPLSHLDRYIKAKLEGTPPLDNEGYAAEVRTRVTATPAARNSVPYDNRRVCHGNTNCTPICPIQAKYDAGYALGKALATGQVDILYQTVVVKLNVPGEYTGTGVNITNIEYLTYQDVGVPANDAQPSAQIVTAGTYILAASAIENAKILLNSKWGGTHTAANTSGQVGKNLMDHPTYLAWGLLPGKTDAERAYGYRGPISTAGIESLRDGTFRATRASWRIEIGNEGWNWPTGDPYTTGLDYLYGTDEGGLNKDQNILGNKPLLSTLHDLLTRQFRVAFLIEQDAEERNSVVLSKEHKDKLGIPRPEIRYHLSEYVRRGFESAVTAADQMMKLLGSENKNAPRASNEAAIGTSFLHKHKLYHYDGAGHVCGTHIMGTTKENSVVNEYQLSWDHPNLYIVGCGSMPSIGSQNPTLTMLALTDRTVDKILAAPPAL